MCDADGWDTYSCVTGAFVAGSTNSSCHFSQGHCAEQSSYSYETCIAFANSTYNPEDTSAVCVRVTQGPYDYVVECYSAGCWLIRRDQQGCQYFGGPEKCDGYDNDGDGCIDEDCTLCCEGETFGSCTNGCGESGTLVCNSMNEIYCNARLLRPESCNGLDDDCNGGADDGLNCSCLRGDTRPCCAGGYEHCGEDGTWGQCYRPSDGAALTGPPEVCDGLDNDCDGLVDIGEGLDCPDCATTGGNTPCANCLGEPVDLGTGLVTTHVLTDVVLDDPFMPIVFARRWSSTYAMRQAGRGSRFHKRMGTGWSHTFDENLVLNAGGAHGTAPVIWTKPDGGQVVFPYVSGSYLRPPGTQDTLTFASGMYVLTTSDGTIASFTPEAGSGRARLFRREYGPVSLSADYFGDGDPDCVADATHPAGWLCKVSTTTGRRLHFNYENVADQGYRVTSVSESAAGAALATFSYTATACGMTTADCNGSSLCCVRFGTAGENYRYDTALLYPRLRQVDSTTGEVTEKHTWTEGKVTTTETRDISATLVYGGCSIDGQTGLSIADAASGAAGAPLTSCRVFQNGVVTTVQGGCTCANEQYVWSTGASRTLLREVDRRGILTTHAYDSLDRRTFTTRYDDDTSAINAPPAGGQRLETQYHSTSGLPSMVRRASVRAGAAESYVQILRGNDPVTGDPRAPLVTALTSAGQTITDASQAFVDSGTGWSTVTSTATVSYEVNAGAVLTRTVAGPGAGQKTEYMYHYVTNLPSSGRLRWIRRYSTPTTYLETRFGEVTPCGPSGYDIYGHPLTLTDENGVTTCNFYDQWGRLTETRVLTDPSTAAVRYSYSEDGSLFREEGPGNAVVEYEWAGGSTAGVSAHLLSAVTRLPSVNGPILSRSEIEYHLGLPHRNLPKLERELFRDAKISTSCVLDADCSGDGSVYCNAGQCAALPCTSHAQCSATGSARCGPEGTCLTVGGITEFEYDSERRLSARLVHRQTASPGAADAREEMTYDAAGNLETLRPESAAVVTEKYLYDVLGRVRGYQKRVGTAWVDAASYTSDIRGNPREMKHFDFSLPGSSPLSTTQYQHDDFDRLVLVDSPDAGKVVYRFDAAGRLAERIAGSGTVTRYETDLLGRPKKIDYPTDADVTTNWDEETSPSVTDCRTGVMHAWAPRHALGRISSRTDASGTSHFGYDSHGRLTTKLDIRTVAGETCARVWTWTYDVQGRLTARRYPTGRVVEYDYVGLDPDRPSSIRVHMNGVIRTVVSDVRYGPAGEVRRFTSGNGVVNEAEFFLDGTPKARRAILDGSVLWKRDVVDTGGSGSPTDVNGLDSRTSETFGYDAETEALTSAAADTYVPGTPGTQYGQRSFSYERSPRALRLMGVIDDAAFHSSTAYTYVSGSSRLQSTHETTTQSGVPAGEWRADYTWTPHGALGTVANFFRPDSGSAWVSDGSASLVYDEEARLKTIGITNHYDARSLRTRKISDTGTPSEFFYDDSGELVAEVGCFSSSDCSGNRPLQEYVWFGGVLVGIIESTIPTTGEVNDTGAALKWVHAGLLGEPRRVTADAGLIVWALDVPPFGLFDDASVQQTTAGITTTLAVGLPGQYFDTETRLHYNWHRFYMPDLGIYLQADPLIATGEDQATAFAYVDGLPTGAVDPTGLNPASIIYALWKYKEIGLAAYDCYKTLSDPCAPGYLKAAALAQLAMAALSPVKIPAIANAVDKGRKALAAARGIGGAAKGSREARREVMREQGIPTSQTPMSQSRNASGREYTYEVPKRGGGTEIKAVQQQTLDRSHPGQGHWEGGAVKTHPRTGEVRMNPYGWSRLTSDKSKVDYGDF